MKNIFKPTLMILALCSTMLAKSQTPVLNSYPSANAVILLDFDGHFVSGTSWNVSGPITCNSSGLNSAAQMTEVFNRVAEDFRPFNVNITTEESKYTAAPVNKRVRVIITTTNEWYGTSAGGVAFLNSFVWGDDTPCFVFSALHFYSLKNIAEAASHEAGHTLGLRHQSVYSSCTKISEYNWGTGVGEIGWAPIMGAGYNRNLTVWHNGPNATGCSNFQSELSIISNATNGFGFRTDDHTDVFSTATTANFDASFLFNINGVIEKTDDKDLFKFTIPVFSQFVMSAVPYNVGTSNSGSNLDLQVELLDASQASLALYNPGTTLNSIVDTFINAGTYYLRIDGKGNTYAPEYGSLGSYSLQASYADASLLALRRLELKGQLDREIHSLNWLVEADEKMISQVLEVSADGRRFAPLSTPGISDRNYKYHPLEAKPLQYRLHVTFENNKQYYSNVITIRNGIIGKPQLVGNTISGNNLTVNSPGNYNYQLFDQSGRMMSRGTVSKGFSSISTGNIAQGIYIIRFSDQDEFWSEKFIKR